MYRRSGRSRLILLGLLVLSGVLVTLDHRGGDTGLADRFRDGAQGLAAPVQRAIGSALRPIGDLAGSLGELADLRDRNEALEAEVRKLTAEVARSQALLEENSDLRAQLALKRSWRGSERVTAQVVADAPGNYRWSVVIDRGSADGVARDMPVLAPEGLVGKVVRVDARQATVLLLVDPSAAAAARVEGAAGRGIVSGNGLGRPLSFEFVDKDAGAAVGDAVVTSNMSGGLFPPGIPIGSITAIEGDDRALEYAISVEPHADLSELSFVEVLLLDAGTPEGVAAP